MYPWLIASASGQRKYTIDEDDSSDDDEEEDNDKDSLPIDNSLKIWRVPGHTELFSYPTTITADYE